MMARQQTKRRIELGWFEAVVLAIGYVASLGMVGLAGFIIGQRTVPENLGRQERMLRLPVSASGGSKGRQLGSAEPEMTFYEELLQEKGEPAREGRIIVPEKEPEKQPKEPPQKPKKKLPGTTQVRSDKSVATPPSRSAPAESAKVAPNTEKIRADVKPPEPVQQTGSGASEPPVSAEHGATRRVTAEARATAQAIRDAGSVAAPRAQGPVSGLGGASRLPSPPPGVTREAAATARELGRTELPAAPAGTSTGTWSVQVNATQDEALATNLARGLRERGYDAFVVEQSREGVTWYRVRVGRLKSIEMANALVSKLKETEDLPHAFVASD